MTELSAIKERLAATSEIIKEGELPEMVVLLMSHLNGEEYAGDIVFHMHAKQDLSRLIEAVEVMDRALEKIEWMNQPPKSSTTRSLASEARAKVKAILSGGKSETKEV